MMERINRILHHPVFLHHMRELERLEQARIFCRHDLEHLLSVARLMRIRAQECDIPLSVELIYAAALLHDLGRVEQYLNAEPHHEAGVRVSAPILSDCGFSDAESSQVLSAIYEHRSDGCADDLSALLQWADKKSRPCYACQASTECNWPQEKRNLTLEI